MMCDCTSENPFHHLFCGLIDFPLCTLRVKRNIFAKGAGQDSGDLPDK
jgi:hypothetical protein